VLSFFAVALASVALLSCSSSNSDGGNNGAIDDNKWPFDASGENLPVTPDMEALRGTLNNVIEIKYNNGNPPGISNSYANSVKIDVSGENVVVTIQNETEYNFIISGTAKNGSLKFYGDVRNGLYLNGVNITNNSGPAINIQKSKRVEVHLVYGTENFLTDGRTYSNVPAGEQAKGAFFSEGKLYFTGGNGSLEVRGKYNHAIVVDNDFEIENGKIIISEAANDGIHANDKIEVKGGVLKITSKGDAIQSEENAVEISGGKVAARTTGPKSHGISSFDATLIEGNAIVQISVSGNGSKGIKSDGYVSIKDGVIGIKASGARHIDNDDESTAAGIKVNNSNLDISGGALTIESIGDKAKGINVANDFSITNGNVHIEADDDGIKVHGRLSITGGTVYTKSKKKNGIDAGNGRDGIAVDVTDIDGAF
jgi:hypothetical protein